MRDKQIIKIIQDIHDCLEIINLESHVDIQVRLTPKLEELQKEIDSTGY